MLLLLLHLLQPTLANTVKFQLDSDWKAPSILLQTIEFVGAASGAKGRYHLLESLSSFDKGFKSDSDAYSQLIESGWIKDYVTSDLSLALLKASLATHAYAPAIVAHHHYYSQTIAPQYQDLDASCSVWVDVSGKQACTFEKFLELRTVSTKSIR